MALSAHSGAISECDLVDAVGAWMSRGGGGGWRGGSGSALVVNRMEQVRAELEEEWEARDDVGLSIVEIDPQTQVS